MFLMTRSAADFWGLHWPPEVASCVGNGRERRYVTWDEVMESRRCRQAERLAEKYRVEPPRIQPCYVWVFFVPPPLYAGWWCYVRTLRECRGVNFPGFMPGLATSIMREFPCGLLPVIENFDKWMPAFAKAYPRPKTGDLRRAGSRVGWLQKVSEGFDFGRFAADGRERRPS